MYRCTDEIRTQRRIEREKAFPKIVGIHIGEKVKVPVLMVSDKTARYLEAVVEYIDRDLDLSPSAGCRNEGQWRILMQDCLDTASV